MIKEDLLNTELVQFNHNISNVPSKDYLLHCHNSFELYYFMGGDVEYLVEGCEYIMEPDSILLIGPNIFHGVKVNSSAPYHRASIHFNKELLNQEEQELLLSPFFQSNLYYLNASHFRLDEYIQSILECRDLANPIQNIALKARIYSMLTQIYAMFSTGCASISRSDQQVQEIIAFLNHSLTLPVSLDSIAKHFFISKNHLNSIFKKATGTTVGNYIIHKRITLAQSWIREGKPVVQAASDAGFQDYSNFYRSYRKILGCSPFHTKGSH